MIRPATTTPWRIPAPHRSPDPSPGGRLTGDGSSDVVFGARRSHGDGGYTMALTALMLVPLMFFVAIAIDLGAWLAQAAKLQRAADAAAMAAVVWMPQATAAQTAATAAARANGFVTGGAVKVTPAPGAQATDYQVTIAAAAPRFFSQAVGVGNFTISRTAVARYNNPIPLGSPVNQFGNDPSGCLNSQPTTSCGTNPMVWAAVNGPFAGRASGDPYSVKCTGNGDNGYIGNAGTCLVPTNANGAQNPDFDPDGYSFAVDVGPGDVGRPLSLLIYDAAQIERSPSECGSSSFFNFTAFLNCQAGDWATSYGASPAPLEVTLYENDNIGAAVTYPRVQAATSPPEGATGAAASACRLYVPANASAATFKNRWVPVCSFTPTQPGIFPFRVRSSGGPATARTGAGKAPGTPNPITDYTGAPVTDRGSGINAFSFRVQGSSSTTSTRVYGLDNLSVYTNTPGSTARFYLAEVAASHAGKKLRIDLFDPGDGTGSNTYSLQVLGPASGAPATVPSSSSSAAYPCRYNATPSATFGPATPDVSDTCTITTKLSSQNDGGVYQDRWLRVEILIPGDYTCPTGTSGSPDCWWTIRYSFGSGGDPYDRTVWSMAVVGDPVHLIQ